MFYWDENIRRFRDAKGKFVADSKIHSWLDEFFLIIASYWADKLASYKADEISFQEFFDSTRQEIESLHRAVASIAFGGVKHTSDDEFDSVETIIQDQVLYFYNFAIEIYNEMLSEKQMKSRFALYALAGFATYEAARTFREAKAGMLIYRRILDAGAENCSDCIDYALRGWQLIGNLPAIGNSKCRTRCRCHFKYSKDLKLLRN